MNAFSEINYVLTRSCSGNCRMGCFQYAGLLSKRPSSDLWDNALSKINIGRNIWLIPSTTSTYQKSTKKKPIKKEKEHNKDNDDDEKTKGPSYTSYKDEPSNVKNAHHIFVYAFASHAFSVAVATTKEEAGYLEVMKSFCQVCINIVLFI